MSFFFRISVEAFHPQVNFIKVFAAHSNSQKHLKLYFIEPLGLHNY